MSQLPVAKKASPLWWVAVWIAVAAAIASFVKSGGGTIAGGVVAIVTNPLVWLGAFAYGWRVRCIQCPHCGKWEDRSQFGNVAAGSVVKHSWSNDPGCGNDFIFPAA